ncbi:uncharacterized protein LOC108742019 [Agrilus planipennis]|uniref:Uncharacterized protein LOC108742019 n=1 Tax=Agrilus planipennis TaxID=224129 RepID=A0A1W4XJH5_AGRPL|nr:uncharacterized protein LOC108742019 [Agrilus planipennis]
METVSNTSVPAESVNYYRNMSEIEKGKENETTTESISETTSKEIDSDQMIFEDDFKRINKDGKNNKKKDKEVPDITDRVVIDGGTDKNHAIGADGKIVEKW